MASPKLVTPPPPNIQAKQPMRFTASVALFTATAAQRNVSERQKTSKQTKRIECVLKQMERKDSERAGALMREKALLYYHVSQDDLLLFLQLKHFHTFSFHVERLLFLLFYQGRLPGLNCWFTEKIECFSHKLLH